MAIDRCSRFVHLAVYDAETAANAVAFLAEAQKAFPFRITHVLTDRGSCFTAEDFEHACATLKVIRRTTRPYTPQTHGMVERFNGRVASEVLGNTVFSHADLKVLLTGFNQAYNRRRQRVLSGVPPLDTVRRRLEHNNRLQTRATSQPTATTSCRRSTKSCSMPMMSHNHTVRSGLRKKSLNFF